MNSKLQDIITFSEASEIWGLSKSTLNKAVGKKLIENIDCKKSASTWLVTKEAMIREYGLPNRCFNLDNTDMFLNKFDFKSGNGFISIFNALENAKGKEIQIPWLPSSKEFDTVTLLDFKMFAEIAGYSVILHIGNKYGNYTKIIPNITFFNWYENDKDSTKTDWYFDCTNVGLLSYIQKYVTNGNPNRAYFFREHEVQEGIEKENKIIREFIEDNMITRYKMILPSCNNK